MIKGFIINLNNFKFYLFIEMLISILFFLYY